MARLAEKEKFGVLKVINPLNLKPIFSEEEKYTSFPRVFKKIVDRLFSHFKFSKKTFSTAIFPFLALCHSYYLTAFLEFDVPNFKAMGDPEMAGPPWAKKKIKYRISFAKAIDLAYDLGIFKTGCLTIIKNRMTKKDKEKIASYFLMFGEKMEENAG